MTTQSTKFPSTDFVEDLEESRNGSSVLIPGHHQIYTDEEILERVRLRTREAVRASHKKSARKVVKKVAKQSNQDT